MELATKDHIPSLFSDFQGFHFRLRIECDPSVAWNFEVLFHTVVEIPGTVSVPEKGHVAEFDGLTVRK